MSATSPSSEHFGWGRHNEDPEAWWAGMERMRQLESEAAREAAERKRQAYFRTQVARLLGELQQRGLLREDRLSYTRICELEHETGISTGSWLDYYELLREAQQKDEERRGAA